MLLAASSRLSLVPSWPCTVGKSRLVPAMSRVAVLSLLLRGPMVAASQAELEAWLRAEPEVERRGPAWEKVAERMRMRCGEVGDMELGDTADTGSWAADEGALACRGMPSM